MNSTESGKRFDDESERALEEPQAALYDFLYRDSGRIASFYAQLFSGKLTQLEEVDAERSGAERTGGVNLQIASGNLKSLSETQNTSKRIIDPHDLITTDVLSSLSEQGRIDHDISAAGHGSLVMTQGTLVFADKYMLEVAVSAFEMVTGKKAKTAEEKAGLLGLRMLRTLFSKIEFPSAFLLQGSGGIQVAGTIKESGMEEPISTYYFRHGTAGLSDVFMIGIKEVASALFTLPDTQLLGASKAAAQSLSDILFPPEAIRVTPIALFRKL